MDHSLIEQYAAGGKQLSDALAGLGPLELDAFPIPGTWSVRQIAVHMMDSDMIGSDRMKRVASMDKPLLIGYDETAFAQLPGYESFPIDSVTQLFQLNREQTTVALRNLSAKTFTRYGIHSEKGKVTLVELVEMYVGHLSHHLEFIQKKRKLLGK